MRFTISIGAYLAAVVVLAACTETPSYFPPCVDPKMPCAPDDAGADASDAAALELDGSDAMLAPDGGDASGEQ